MTQPKPLARPRLSALEKKFEDLTYKFAVVGSSATAAMLFGLRSWMAESKIEPGAEVIVSALSPSSTVLNLLTVGLVPVYADIDPDTLQSNVKTIQAVKTDKTAAVFMTHHGGYPAPIDEVWDWCKVRRYTLMDDASQCLPTTYKRWSCGSWPSDLTFFSFHDSKLLSGLDGGVVCAQDDKLAKALRVQRKKDVEVASEEIQGYKAFLPEPKAEQVSNCLHDLHAAYNKRNMVWGIYQRAFETLDGAFLPWDDSKGVIQSCDSYSLKVDGSRDAVAMGLTRKNIKVPRPVTPVYKLGIWQLPQPTLPALEAFLAQEISLPITHRMNLVEVNLVVEAIKRLV